MTFFLWDLAGTLFVHSWDPATSGFGTYEDYLQSRGWDAQKLSPYEFENSHILPLAKGWFGGTPVALFKEVLVQTKNNFVFTTGNKEQLDARAKFLLPQIGFDLSTIFHRIYSTFDFGPTNVKTPEMFQAIARDALAKGFDRIVYTDDNPKLTTMFKGALKEVPQIASMSYTSLVEVKNKELRAN